MIARPAKFPAGKPKSYDAKKQEFKYPKTVLNSLDNPKRLAKASTRARLISQLVEPQDQDPMPREFSSYFLSNTDTSDPAYLVSSHANDIIPTQSPVVPTYPIQNLRWNPYIETSTLTNCKESQIQFEVKKELYHVPSHKFTCKCRNCTNLCCPSKTQFGKTGLKNNIMTFCDKCTMTLKLNSSGCGSVTPISCTPVVSEASVTRSDVAVRDKTDHVPFHCPLPQQFHPTTSRHHVDSHCTPPILKKPVLQSSYYKEFDCATRSPVLMDMEAERDVPDAPCYREAPCYPEATCYPEPPCYTEALCWKNCKDRDQLYARKSGKTLYNEGIIEEGENMQAFYRPRRRSRSRSVSAKRKKSGVSFSSFFSKDDEAETTIPHSHRHDSKYHYACMDEPHESYRCQNNDRRGLLASPKITRRCFQSVQQCKPTPYVLPKRVLTSNPDYNIEKFLQNNCCRIPEPKKKKRFSFFK